MEMTKSKDGIATIDSTKDFNVKLCNCLIKLHDTVAEFRDFEQQFNLLSETERKKFNTRLTNVISRIAGCSDQDGEDMLIDVTHEGKEYGFHYATVSGVSWGMDDLQIPENKNELIVETEKNIEENKSLYEQGLLTEYERKSKAIELWTLTKGKL